MGGWRRSTAFAGWALLVATLFAAGISTLVGAPDYAAAWVNDSTQEYFAPPCLASTAGLRKTSMGDARAIGYHPNRDCVNTVGGYNQDGRSLLGLFMEKIGVLPPLESRWDRSGEWQW
ncbi:MAG: hypothetical protein ACYC5Y_04935 [Symbiobacteriia bacterium]